MLRRPSGGFPIDASAGASKGPCAERRWLQAPLASHVCAVVGSSPHDGSVDAGLRTFAAFYWRVGPGRQVLLIVPCLLYLICSLSGLRVDLVGKDHSVFISID